MKPKPSSSQRQGNFLYQDLLDQLNPKAPLLLLAKKIPWEKFEREFSPLYADFGRPARPVRLMVGLLLLKQLENVSDERVVEAWVQNPYYQAFCGMEHFQWQFPCDPLELVHFRKRIGQERRDTKKIYSLHEPEVCCISKSKEHKKYEFGSKAAIVMTKTRGIIVGAKHFTRNEYDGNTLEKVLSQVTDIRGSAPETAFCDRGFRGRKRMGDTAIVLPESPSPKASEYVKRKARKNFGRRSAIEPVIGHLKNDFRLARNYLKGTIGNAINLLLAAAAFNCKKWMNAVVERLRIALFALCVATAWGKES